VKYLLDTDTCSYIIKKPELIKRRFEKIEAGEICISAITWAELNTWIMMSSNPYLRQLSLQKMFAPIAILPFTTTDANYHGAIRKHIKESGIVIGSLDMLIAAHALSRGLIVVTNNLKYISRINSLKVENWLEKNN